MFYQKRWLILFNTLFCFSVALVYISYSTPTYQAKTYISAPVKGDIAALNKGRIWDNELLTPMTVREVYAIFNNILFSESAKRAFFKKYYLPQLSQDQKNKFSQAQLYDSLSKRLTIKANPIAASERYVKYTISVSDHDAAQAASLLKQFISLVNQRTRKALLNSTQQENSIVAYNLQHEANIERETAKAQRYDRIAQLKEAVVVAESAGIKAAIPDLGTASIPYAAGTKILEAEIKSLSERQSDDAFIPNLRPLLSKLDFNKSLVINPAEITVSHLDGAVQIPTTPIAPKKSLLIIMSLLLGLMMSAFWIMLQIIWRKEGYGTSWSLPRF